MYHSMNSVFLMFSKFSISASISVYSFYLFTVILELSGILGLYKSVIWFYSLYLVIKLKTVKLL